MARTKTGLSNKRKLPIVSRDGTPDDDGFIGPSPNAFTNLLLADVALRTGARIVRRGLERGLLGKRYAPDKARKILKGRSLGQTLASAAVARLAMHSVPGALVVGGGLLAKTLYDRRKGHEAKHDGEAKIADMAEEGEAQEA